MLSEQGPKSLSDLAVERGKAEFGGDGANYAVGALGAILGTIEAHLASRNNPAWTLDMIQQDIDTARKSLANG